MNKERKDRLLKSINEAFKKALKESRKFAESIFEDCTDHKVQTDRTSKS